MTEPAFLNERLSRRTFIFGLRLWVVVGICVGAAIVIALFLVSLYFTSRRNHACSRDKKKKKKTKKRQERASRPVTSIVSHANPTIPNVSKEILEIRVDHPEGPGSNPDPDPDALALVPQPKEDSPTRLHMEIGKDHRISYPERPGSGGSGPGEQAVAATAAPEVSHLGWGHWYTLRELQVSTGHFADENVIGEGGYGIVYQGVLEDGTRVAVKNLMNNRGQAEKEFKVEVEAIGRVRHKNLVRLVGYCVEGAHRAVASWGCWALLMWENRMNIIIGTAKGLTYLHEGLEPKVVHRDIKSSNILLDKQWNAKVSDFGLAKLLGSERSYVTTRVMGTFGYVAPEYASTGMLNERSDAYSFGILIMEIISGRNPVDYSRPSGEVNLVEWLKTMVTNRNPEGVLDPRLPEKPSSRALKRTLLVALRCVDPNAQKRPKMGHVVHMLEADEFPLRDEILRDRLLDKRVTESGDSSGYESSVQSNMSMLRKQDPEEQ
ncbi:hypothetical protein BT93_E2863 [Corymbia citriodora subsp. variegata]|nr:hypothetical protein BT93_E2863 [Corymbia citriodora subsp. variegata]